MPVAYVLINTEVGAEREVLERLREIPEVTEAHIVFGIYDVIVKVQVERQDQLGEVISSKIRRIERVRYTLTLLSVEGFAR